MSRGQRKNGIPDRWLDYQAVGKRLPGSRFIAFKVPLKLALTNKVERKDVFGPWDLLDALKKKKQELGLIIDLTFTTRYYKPEDVPECLQCVKIFTAGHEIPSDATILSFKRAVYHFLRENADNDKLIGVHCTHGLNRTGYLICRYLIDVDGVDPKRAIEAFNSSRGHAMERQNYLDDLMSGPKRSNAGIEEFEQEPVQGSSRHRPVDSEVNPSSNTEEWQTVESPRHRWGKTRHPPRNDQRSGFSPRSGSVRQPFRGGGDGPGLLPPPGGTGLLPLPSFPPAFGNYRWRPPQANQWSRDESRDPPPGSAWGPVSPYAQRSRGDDHFPSNRGNHSSGQWRNDSDTYASVTRGKWDGRKMRGQREPSHYNNPYGYY